LASTVNNKTAGDAAARLIAGKTYKMMLLNSISTSWDMQSVARVFDFVSELSADEVSHATYSRQDVTVTTGEDDTNDRGEFFYSDVTFTSLSASVGMIRGVVIYEVVTTDANHIIRFIHDVSSVNNNTPDGGNFIVRDGSQGGVWLETT
jgi:hypothetical protein